MEILRTGIDLIKISRLIDINPAIRERFLMRVYTAHELSESGSKFHSLAGKFAAKEAVTKALGCGIGPVQWQDIEIRHDEKNQPVLHLHGKAKSLAKDLQLTHWSISISHEAQYAVAVVVAYSS